MAIQLGPRARRVLQRVGIGLAVAVFFVFALHWTFPYARLKDRLVDGLASKYDVTIGKVARGFWPGSVTFEKVTLRSRPTKPSESANTIFFNSVDVAVGWGTLLGSAITFAPKAAGTVTLGVGAKRLEIEFVMGKRELQFSAQGRDLPAKLLPTREFIVMPMGGLIDIDVAMRVPIERGKQDFAKATGHFQFACPKGCSVGDGSKIKMPTVNARNEAMMGDGVEFGTISIAKLLARLDIGKGNARLSKFQLESPDGEAKLDFDAKLAPVMNDSTVEGCVRYKPSPALQSKDIKTYNQIVLIGGILASDGFFHVKLSDRLGRMRKVGVECGTGKGGDAGKPELTVTPDSETPFAKTDKPTITPVAPEPSHTPEQTAVPAQPLPTATGTPTPYPAPADVPANPGPAQEGSGAGNPELPLAAQPRGEGGAEPAPPPPPPPPQFE